MSYHVNGNNNNEDNTENSSDDESTSNQSDDYEEELLLNEVYFDKCLECLLNNNNELTTNNKNLLNELTTTFRRLLDLYLKSNNWTKVFELIDRVKYEDADLLNKDEIYRACGDFFYKLDMPMQSLNFYRQSIELNEFNLFSLESYENILNAYIERWHYRMINDKTRNYAYSKVIDEILTTIQTPCRVLDIGFGCGLLSVQCLFSKSINNNNIPMIYACEKNEIFHEIAKKCLFKQNEGSNLIENSLKLINKHSNDLNVDVDFDSSQVNIIITEIFDDCLLGECCLNTFYEAIYKNKLIKKFLDNETRFLIVPKYARLYICAIESNEIRKQNYYSYKYNNKEIKVLSFSDCEKFQFMKQVNGCSNDEDCVNMLFEPYTTENLRSFDYKLLTEQTEVDNLSIEFDNYNFLRELCEFNKTIEKYLKLKFISNGYVDAYVAWFNLYLTNNVVLTNSPLLENDSVVDEKNSNATIYKASCWHQAIYPMYDRVGEVNSSINITIEINVKKDCLLLRNLDSTQSQTMYTNYLYANSAEISLLNNSSYQNSIFLNYFHSILTNHILNNSLSINIGIYCQTLNILLIEYLIGKYDTMLRNNNIQLILYVNSNGEINGDYKSYFNSIFTTKEDNDRKFHIVYLDEIDKTKMLFHIDYLLFDPLDCNLGILRKNLFSDLVLIRDLYLKNGKY